MNRKEILDKAEKCVCGKREKEYGTPEDNFSTIASFWSTYKEIEFTADDVAVMMMLLKIARIKSGNATDDSYVDIAGYAACGAEINSLDKEDGTKNNKPDKNKNNSETNK